MTDLNFEKKNSFYFFVLQNEWKPHHEEYSVYVISSDEMTLMMLPQNLSAQRH